MGAANLTEHFRQALDAHSDRIALRAGAQELTYAQVHRGALTIAGSLMDTVDGPVSRVGVLAGNADVAHVAVLGALYAGAAAVPLNPGFPLGRTADMVRAAQLDAVVVDDRGVLLLERLAAEIPDVRWVLATPGGPDGIKVGDGTTVRALDKPLPVPADALAYIMFTSGSTGRPKGVPISQHSVLHFLRAAQARHRVRPDDVLVQTFEPTFDLFMFSLFIAWGAGAELVVLPPQALRRLPDFVRTHRVSLWFSVPSTIRLVRRLGVLTPGSMPSLRRSLFCGEALTQADAEHWRRAASQSVVDNLYGPTELTIACTAHEWIPRNDGDQINGLVPIGHLHEGLRGVLLDEEGTPTQDQGELCVTGPQMTSGYLDPRHDEGRFITLAGARWYRTGDRVRRLNDGGFAYLGRLDAQVKIRGYRVELLEIEHELRRLDGVLDCAVVTIERDGEATLVAAYVGDPAVGKGLPRELSVRLPEYMVPRAFAHVEELSLNSNGKVDRAALTQRVTSQLEAG
jgi:amino acid adenylation domain-containing protein